MSYIQKRPHFPCVDAKEEIDSGKGSFFSVRPSLPISFLHTFQSNAYCIMKKFSCFSVKNVISKIRSKIPFLSLRLCNETFSGNTDRGCFRIMVKRPTTPICGVGLLIWFREWKLSKRPSWQVKHNGTTYLLCSSKIYFFSQTLPNFCLIKSYFVQTTLEWGVYQKAVIQLQTSFERSVNQCLLDHYSIQIDDGRGGDIFELRKSINSIVRP